MDKSLFMRSGGKGVAPWIPLAAIVAVLALLLSLLTVAPTASADESDTDITSILEEQNAIQSMLEDSATEESATPTAEVVEEEEAGSDPVGDSTQPETTGTPLTERETTERPEPRMGLFAANPAVVVEVTSVLKKGSTVADDEKLTVEDTVTVKGEWDATSDTTGVAPQEGDTFTIGFPDELEIRGDLDFNLNAPGNIPLANCVAVGGSREATCTITAAGADEDAYIPAGTWTIEATVTEETEDNFVRFNLNGTATPVPLPGGGGIDPKPEEQRFTTKAGAFKGISGTVATWTVTIPGSALQGEAPYEFTDKLPSQTDGPNAGTMVYVDDSVNIDRGAGVVALDNGDGTLTLTLEPPTGGFDPQVDYKLTYDTKVDGDRAGPAGTTYTNDLEGPGVGPGGVVGKLTQIWNKAQFSKGGRIQVGTAAEMEDRLARITWTVVVPGSKLQRDTNFFGDSLTDHPAGTAGHNYCADFRLDVSEMVHRDTEGGSTSWSAPLSGVFNSGPSISGDRKSFTATSDYEFKEDAQYRFVYTSCADTPGIPEHESWFRNVFTINDEDVLGAVQYRGGNSSKTGGLITEEREINGQTLEPYTALTWNINIPGRHIENNDEPLVLRDLLSAGHKVCEGSGSVKDRLGLKVIARDQVGGQLPQLDLTADTTATSNDGLQITLPRPEGGYNREYQYVITYVTCTASGGDDTNAGVEYTNSVQYEGGSAKGTVRSRETASGTGGIANRGSFTLLKERSSESEKFPEDTVFTVRVEEFGPNGQVMAPYNLQVKANGEPVKGRFVRGEGWTIKLSEINLPQVDGIEFGDPRFAESDGVEPMNGGKEALVTVKPRTNAQVKLFNTARKDEVSLTKVVEGDAKDAVNPNQYFDVTARVNGKKETLSLKAGETITLDELPIGAEVFFEEIQPADNNVITWGKPVFSKNPIKVGEDASVILTNTASASEGTFSLKKVLNGAEASNAELPTSYTVKAAWGDNETAEIDVPANGDVKASGLDLPTGTEVTLTEVLPQVNNIDWGTPVFSGEGVTVNPDGSAVVTIGRGNVDLTVTNTAVRTGTFQLSKGLTGEAAGDVPADAVFTVKAQWQKTGDTQFTTRELQVGLNGTVELGEDLPAETRVRFSEIKFPEIDGVVWGTPVWGTNPTGEQWLTVNNGVAEGIISDDPAEGRLISVTNEARYADRPVYITKQVEGPAAAKVAADLVYKIQAIFPDNEVRTYGITAGEPELIGNFPVGTEITFSEIQPTDTNEITWGEPTFSPKTLTVGTDLRADVTVTNVADQTVGTFSVTKKLDGPEQFNDAVPESFDVIATWTEGTEEKSHTMTVPVGGAVDFATDYGQPLPSGTTVTLTEVLPPNGEGLAWSSATFVEGNEVTIGLDPIKVKLKNWVDKNDGTLQVLKAVTGDAAEGIESDVEFTVKAEWKKPGSTATNFDSTRLTLKNDGVAVPLGLDLPVGTEVRFTEIDLPEIEGIEWDTPQWDVHQPEGSWLRQDAEGVATGIVSDDPAEGRIIKLTNEATWKTGELEITKKIVDGDKIYDVKDSSIDEDSEFEVRITGIDPALPDDVNFPKVGQSFRLNKANDWTWSSGKVLLKGTKVTFEEVNLRNTAGYDWAKPYYVTGTEGEFVYGSEIVITGGDKTDTVEIHNRLIPTTEVDIDKIVTGPKGNEVENDASSTFQVTARWQDADGQDRTCVLNVTPRGGAVPTSKCDATVIDGKVHFPTNTEITFTETGAYTDVPNVKWGEVIWSADRGAEVSKVKGDKKNKKHQAAATVVFTGGKKNKKVTLGLENKTSSDGLILLPLPIPLLPFGGGSSVVPVPTNPTAPAAPGEPGKPTEPAQPAQPSAPGEPGKPVSQEKQDQHAQVTPGKRGLASTGANVLWLTGGAAALILGGAWLALRGRRNES
ncbi:DUF5979 domain-containing protein [Corynebacterium sp. YIM 101645]|uniref:DUF5979 domain-containing protein n=1 Tax=Corynebacterium lemuris TaxID=1859292 RepID=A0ABT2FSS3_9CORY|nr:DUF5979 domain-containing protein [Corynebacterium lemuris]MCS5478273.1 DUF5979 domain-containing protein [Corynebacterium lemuris]